MIRSFSLAFAAMIAVGAMATAQTQTVCFTSSIPLTNTNWSNSVTIPKFDSGLGTLQSINFTLGGNIQGQAAVESLDTSATNVTLNFQATLTLTRPDTSVIVVTIPIATFNDSLTPFDGTIDFAGPSGESHPGINVSASNNAISPPPPSDLVLFSGPPGSPGTITLPITAAGSSTAVGSGNVISQFQTAAAAQVQVCYTYLVNTPPTFGSPTPVCGSTIPASAGVPVSFTVCAGDTNGADTVTLTSAALPAGATTVPALPAAGNPVCVTVNWTPSVAQIGNTAFNFTATDNHGRQATCGFNVLTAECYQFIGRGAGGNQIIVGGQLFNTHLTTIRYVYPVTMTDRPSIKIPVVNTGTIQFSMQTLMHNSEMFPQNPDQWSHRMQITVYPGQLVTGALYDTFNGIHQNIATYTDPNGQRYVTFPFTIDGM